MVRKEKDALQSGQINKGLCLSRNNPLHKYRVYNNHFSSHHGEKDLVLWITVWTWVNNATKSQKKANNMYKLKANKIYKHEYQLSAQMNASIKPW